MNQTVKIGIAGCGALGSIVARALVDGIAGFELIAISDVDNKDFGVPNLSFADLAVACDLVVECLPPAVVPALAADVLKRDKDLLMISACAILLSPEIKDMAHASAGRILVPSGALCGLDAVSALAYAGIDHAKIASTKPPRGFAGAPYVVDNAVDLAAIKEKILLFQGNAFEAAKAFPANVNVAATLSLAGIGPADTIVEVWADPHASGNRHEISVQGGSSTITSTVENTPDPDNPKSSMLAGYSIIATLKKQTQSIVVT